MTYEEALALLIKKNENLNFVPKITSTHFDGGGDYQIGDMTWDHENASLEVRYRDPAGTPGKTWTYRIDMEYYGLDLQAETQRASGFAALIEDLIGVAETPPTWTEPD